MKVKTLGFNWRVALSGRGCAGAVVRGREGNSLANPPVAPSPVAVSRGAFSTPTADSARMQLARAESAPPSLKVLPLAELRRSPGWTSTTNSEKMITLFTSR